MPRIQRPSLPNPAVASVFDPAAVLFPTNDFPGTPTDFLGPGSMDPIGFDDSLDFGISFDDASGLPTGPSGVGGETEDLGGWISSRLGRSSTEVIPISPWPTNGDGTPGTPIGPLAPSRGLGPNNYPTALGTVEVWEIAPRNQGGGRTTTQKTVLVEVVPAAKSAAPSPSSPSSPQLTDGWISGRGSTAAESAAMNALVPKKPDSTPDPTRDPDRLSWASASDFARAMRGFRPRSPASDAGSDETRDAHGAVAILDPWSETGYRAVRPRSHTAASVTGTYASDSPDFGAPR